MVLATMISIYFKNQSTFYKFQNIMRNYLMNQSKKDLKECKVLLRMED